MARIRTIKPEFFKSETVTELPLAARLTFIGLWTHSDDEGRCKDNARLIKSALWPLDDSCTANKVDEHLSQMERLGLIQRYQNADGSYIQIAGWFEHQYIQKPTPSSFPSPNEVYERIHVGLQESYDSVPARKGKERNRERKGKEPEGFAEWYQAYPRHEAPIKAAESYSEAMEAFDDQQLGREVLLAGAVRYASDPNRKSEYTKLPSTWLNQGCWSDDPKPNKSESKSRTTELMSKAINQKRLEESRGEVRSDRVLGNAQ